MVLSNYSILHMLCLVKYYLQCSILCIQQPYSLAYSHNSGLDLAQQKLPYTILDHAQGPLAYLLLVTSLITCLTLESDKGASIILKSFRILHNNSSYPELRACICHSRNICFSLYLEKSIQNKQNHIL